MRGRGCKQGGCKEEACKEEACEERGLGFRVSLTSGSIKVGRSADTVSRAATGVSFPNSVFSLTGDLKADGQEMPQEVEAFLKEPSATTDPVGYLIQQGMCPELRRTLSVQSS